MEGADLLEAVEIETTGEIDRRSFCGRGCNAGYGHWNADPDSGMVSIDLADSRNDEFWLHLHLTRAQLQAMLDALPGGMS